MNQDISICVLTENEMGWTEPFELDKVQILDLSLIHISEPTRH